MRGIEIHISLQHVILWMRDVCRLLFVYRSQTNKHTGTLPINWGPLFAASFRNRSITQDPENNVCLPLLLVILGRPIMPGEM